MELFRLTGKILCDNTEANNSISKTSEKAEGLGGKFTSGVKTAAKWAAGITVAASAAAASVIKMASSYEDSFAKLNTLLTGTENEIIDYKNRIIEASNATGVSASDMSEAVYNAISAGVDQANAIDFVTNSLKLAKGGFTDTATAVDVLTTAVNAYGLSSEEATHIADALITTQNLGKTTVNELASSMGKVIPLASAYNVDIDNLSASYAQLTKGGIATAESTTYMKGMLTELSKDSKEVAKVLKEETGKGFAELMKDGYSLGDVLQILNDHVGGDATAFANLWGSVEAGTGALALVNAGADSFNETLNAMRTSTGATEQAFGTMEETFSAKVEKLKTNLTNIGIQLGETLMPVIMEIVDKIMEYMPEIQEVCGTVLSAIMDAVRALIPVIEALWPIVKQLWDGLVKPLLEAVCQFLTGIFTGDIKGAFEGIINIITSLWNGIKTILKTPLDWFLNLLETWRQKATEPFRKLGEAIGSIWESVKSKFKLPHFTLSGSLNPLKWATEGTPKVGVEWYAKGGIMNDPTMFGFNPMSGNAMVGGEAGPEAIAPISTLEGYFKKWSVNDALNEKVDALIGIISAYLPDIANKQLVLDTGVLVGGMSNELNKSFYRTQAKEKRGL